MLIVMMITMMMLVVVVVESVNDLYLPKMRAKGVAAFLSQGEMVALRRVLFVVAVVVVSILIMNTY
jgi:hypothetical protein